MALTKNKKVLDFVQESADLAQPDKIVWIDGNPDQIKALKEEAVKSGELIKLNENLLPDCYLHRTKVNDVARVEDRTFICTTNKEDAGPINYWMDPRQAKELSNEIARGSMKGRTMYVIPYSMGVVGSDFAKYGIEVTDSIYVVLNMNIMTRVGKSVLNQIGKDGDFIKGFHAKVQRRRRQEIYNALPRRKPYNFGQFRIRRQRSSRQEVLRFENCFLPRQKRGLDGRAYAYSRGCLP